MLAPYRAPELVQAALKQSQEAAEELQMQLNGALRQVAAKEDQLEEMRREAEEAQGLAEAAKEAAEATAKDVRAAKAEVAQLEEAVRRGRLELEQAKRQGLGQVNELQEKVCLLPPPYSFFAFFSSFLLIVYYFTFRLQNTISLPLVP